MNVRNIRLGIYGGLAGGAVFGAMMGMMGMLPMIGKMAGHPSALFGFFIHMVRKLLAPVAVGKNHSVDANRRIVAADPAAVAPLGAKGVLMLEVAERVLGFEDLQGLFLPRSRLALGLFLLLLVIVLERLLPPSTGVGIGVGGKFFFGDIVPGSLRCSWPHGFQ